MAISNEEYERRLILLNKGLANSQKIMKSINDGSFDKYASTVQGKSKSLYDNFDLTQGSSLSSAQSYQTIESSGNTKKYKGLPKAIYESLVNNPLNESTSVLDNLFSNGKLVKENNEQQSSDKTSTVSFTAMQNNLNENRQQQQMTTSNIDYSLIRMIVEDVITKKLESLPSSLLKESKDNDNVDLTTIRINGDKLNFLTSNGDLYEAELKFVRNIKKKK